MRRIVFLLGLLASAAAAQPVPVEPGDRVRVVLPERLLVGEVVSVSGGELLLRLRPVTPEPVALSGAEGMDVRVPHSRWRGAGIGALVGAGVAAGVTLVTAKLLDQPESMAGGFALIIGLTVVVPTSAVLGAGIGALRPGSRWERVPSNGVALGVSPQGASLRVTF